MTYCKFISIQRAQGIYCKNSQFGIHFSLDNIDFYEFNAIFNNISAILWWPVLSVEYPKKQTVHEILDHKAKLHRIQIAMGSECIRGWKYPFHAIAAKCIRKIQVQCNRGKFHTLHTHTTLSRQTSSLKYKYNAIAANFAD